MLKAREELTVRVFKNSAGVWGYLIELGTDVAGKRRQKKSVKYSTKKDALKAGNQFVSEYNVLSDKEYSKKYMSEVIEDFLEWNDNRANIKPSTKRSRRQFMPRIREHFGQLKISDLSSSRHQDFINGLKPVLKYNTIANIHVTLKMIYEFLIEKNVLTENYADNIDLKIPVIYAADNFNDKDLPVILERSELPLFLEVLKSKAAFRYYVMTILLLNTGLRIGEACALEWQDLDREAPSVKIYKTFYSERGRYDEYEKLAPKYPASNRVVHISTDDLVLLEEWERQQDIERSVSRTWNDKDNFMFTNMQGRGAPCQTSTLSRILKNLRPDLKAAGIDKKITPHTLRHTHVSLLAQAGATLQQIKARVGHGDGKVTERIYLHVTKESAASAVTKYYELIKKRD